MFKECVDLYSAAAIRNLLTAVLLPSRLRNGHSMNNTFLFARCLFGLTNINMAVAGRWSLLLI